MENILFILGILALIGGLVGSVLPLPGPPLSYLGLILLSYSNSVNISQWGFVTFGIITFAVTVLDYYVPILGIKKFGGTNYGVWGSTIGVVIGFFVVPAVGIFLGAFLGALIGELIGGMSNQKALKAAFGSFLGFLSGIVMKILVCVAMIIYAIYCYV